MPLEAALFHADLPTPHDAGIADVADLSGRLAYAALCLTLCWGVLTATGWVRRTTGRQALLTGHLVLATFALATGAVHALSLLLDTDDVVTFAQLAIPFYGGGPLRTAFGVIGLELTVAVSVTAALRRGLARAGKLRFHQFGYVAVALLVTHSWLGAAADGHLALDWLGGITLVVPPVLLAFLRVLPARLLVRIGLIADAPDAPPVGRDTDAALRITVDDHRCHRYGLCQAEAPGVFQLGRDGRLEYVKRPGTGESAHVRAAARACPMRAIQLEGALR